MLDTTNLHFKSSNIFIALIVIVVSLFTYVRTASAAACNVAGQILINTTWGPGICDPYIVTGNIVVQPGATLTIQPGTQMRFTADKAITVNGGLAVLGSPGNPVLFTSNIGTAAGDWSYIYFAPSSTDAIFDSRNYLGGSTIQYATIEYGGNNSNNFAVLRIDSASPFIDHVTIQHNQYVGIKVTGDGRPRLTNNILNDNGGYGIVGYAVSLGGEMIVRGNTVSNHTDTGIYFLGSSGGTGTLKLDQNTVTNSGNEGIYLSGVNIAAQNNTISGNRRGLELYVVVGLLQNNTITGNGIGPSHSDGAGIYSSASDSVTFYHNEITNNIGLSYGGGICVFGSPSIAFNHIAGNSLYSVSGRGGGIYINGSPSVTYNHIMDNSVNPSSGQGGGIYVAMYGNPIINNNDLFNNSANQGYELYNNNAAWQPNLNAKNNYWGTTDSAMIEDHIWDYVDSLSLGVVDYIPYLNGTPVLVTLQSVGSFDGWIMETSETTNKGGTLNNTASTFNLGDNVAKKQYRGILSFNTAPLPDGAVITSVTLRVKQQAIVGGGNPITTFQGFMVDVKNGTFGISALQITDFQSLAAKTYGPFNTALVNGWYSINLTPGKVYINKLSTNGGLTQIRLRFKLDDNNNTIANYLSLYSGNAPAADRPQLVITYTP